MKDNRLFTKKVKNTFIIALGIVIILIIAGFVIMKYDVQGEKVMPFKLSKINIVCSAKEETVKNEKNEWNMKILQNNDLYFYIEKNEKTKKDLVIDKIIFNNFNIISDKYKENINIYKPTDDEVITYKYTNDFETEEIIYNGAQITNTKFMEINNQGGMIEFSIANIDLGNYIINQEQTLYADGRLLNLIGVNYSDAKFKVSFDMTIVIENGNKYKATISLDLPCGNITEQGICSEEKTDLEDVIFKRI